MPTIRNTKETMIAIRHAAIYDFHQTGRRQADGTWLVEISDVLAERLAKVALSGETVDDTIQRTIRQYRRDRPN